MNDNHYNFNFETYSNDKSIFSGEIYEVSQLNAKINFVLQNSFDFLCVIGEVSNLAIPNSGHAYFTLKDDSSQIKCVLFKTYQDEYIKFIKNGDYIIVYANLKLYSQRGEYQLVIEKLEQLGKGKINIEFERLKKKLFSEGLFDAKYKKSLPVFPKTVGVITSETGAVIRDILNVLKRRCKLISVIIYPVCLHGAKAALEVDRAIRNANKEKKCDVLILARGGGSVEDLSPFNDEILARRIFESSIPIVSGIGHETDYTISDFVSDVRAPTPSAAAEIVSPDMEEQFLKVKKYVSYIDGMVEKNIQKMSTKIDMITSSTGYLFDSYLKEKKNNLTKIINDFIFFAFRNLDEKKEKLFFISEKIREIDPRDILVKGYAIITNNKGIKIKSTKNLKIGETITISLRDGTVNALILEEKS